MTTTKEYIRPTMKAMDVQPMVLMGASDPEDGTLGINGNPTNGMSGDSQSHRGTLSNLWGVED